MVFYICEVFHENISIGFQLTETQAYGRNGYVKCSKGNNFKRRQTRNTIYKFCTLSHGALNLCSVSLKDLKRFPTYRADTSTWMVEMAIFKIYNVQRAVTPTVA